MGLRIFLLNWNDFATKTEFGIVLESFGEIEVGFRIFWSKEKREEKLGLKNFLSKKAKGKEFGLRMILSK